jgi:hypothetical protein
VTHYEVLGVAPTADAATVRRAYLHLARTHHPDYHVGDDVGRRRAERTMQRVNEAWAVLGDETKRRAYDRTLPPDARPRGPRPGFEPKPGPPRAGHGAGSWRDAEAADIAGDLEDDDPLTDAHVRGSWTLLPVGLFVGAVALFSVSMVLQAAPLLALAVIMFLGSMLGFVLLPFVAMASSRSDDLADGGRA